MGLTADGPGAVSLVAFATTTFLMNITPGPAVMQVVGHSLSNGWKPAQASIAGIFAGSAMYCALSVLGLGALILAVPSIFEIIKWLGVGYLAWLGLKALRSASRGVAPLQAPALRARPLTLFRQSFVLQGSNPKAVLYFCTLLPVFAGDAEGAAWRIVVLGFVGTAMEYPVLLGYSMLAAQVARWFGTGQKLRVLDAVSGAALVAASGSVATATLRNR